MPEPDRKFQDEEPSATMREMARSFREMYVAFVHEGFTEREALELLSRTVQAAMHSRKENGG